MVSFDLQRMLIGDFPFTFLLEVDGNLITSRQPDDIPAVNEQLIKALAD
nr:hypothetical protein [Pseudomonas sp. NBRC 111139]